MKLGISSYSLTWSIGVPGYEEPIRPLTVVDLLRTAHENQLALVQIADNLPLHRLNEGELLAIKSAADSFGIEIEVGTRGTDPTHLLQYLYIAEILGATLVRTLIMTQDLELPLRQLLQVLPQFEASGVRIAVENHGLHTTKQLTALFASIDHPTIGCCLDTVNSFSALDIPERVIHDLVPYILNLHIKDFTITRLEHQMGYAILGTPAGAGKLNIGDLLTSIHNHGKNPSAILELWTPYTNSVEETIRLEWSWFEQSLSYLKTNHFSDQTRTYSP